MPKLIILHGWGQSKEIWQQFVNDIDSQGAEAIDLPGFGKEPLVSQEWGVPEYAKWVSEKLQKDRHGEIILLGHSFGGRIASYIASKNPAWLKGIILVGAPCIYRPSTKLKLRIRFYKLAKLLIPESLRSKLFYSKEMRDAKDNGLAQVFRKVVPFDQTEELKQIKIPTLILWGKNDEHVPLRIAKEMNQLIAGSKLEVIQNAGHQTIQDSPYLSYGIIKKFIQNL